MEGDNTEEGTVVEGLLSDSKRGSMGGPWAGPENIGWQKRWVGW
jgi:hypothetical protein